MIPQHNTETTLYQTKHVSRVLGGLSKCHLNYSLVRVLDCKFYYGSKNFQNLGKLYQIIIYQDLRGSYLHTSIAHLLGFAGGNKP